MSFWYVVGVFWLGAVVGAFYVWATKRQTQQATWLHGFRVAMLEASDLIEDRGNFQMYDTEGTSGTRLASARALFEVELELRALASEYRQKIVAEESNIK